MNTKQAIRIFLAVSFLTPALSRAGASGAGAVFKLGAGSRAGAMSEAFTAGSGDPSVLFYNPAGLAREKGSSAMLAHALWFESVSYTAGAYTRQVGKYGAFGFGLQILNYGDIGSTDNNGAADGTFSPRDIALSAGLGKVLDEQWSAGAQAKYLSSKIDKSASAFLVDVGLQYRLKALTAGLAVQNSGAKLKFNAAGESVPVQVRLGAAYGWSKVTAYGDVNFPTDSKTWLALGGEYKAYSADQVTGFLRAGFSTRAAAARNDKTFPFSFGLGVEKDAMKFDYAFVPYGDLGQAHNLTFGYRWGGL